MKPLLTGSPVTDLPGDGVSVLLVDGLAQTPHYDAELVRALLQEGCHPRLWAARRPEEQRPPTEGQLEPALIRRAGLLFRSAGPRRVARGLSYLISLQTVPQIARSHDIVHIQWLPLLAQTSLELSVLRRIRGLGRPLVYTAHNAMPHEHPDNATMVRFAVAYQLCDAILVHGEVVRSQLISEFDIRSERITTVPMGPMLAEASEVGTDIAGKPSAGDELIILQFGTIRRYKGCDVLLSAVPALIQEVPEARVVVAGRALGGIDRELNEQLARLGIEKHCQLQFDYLPDDGLIRLIDRAAVVVFPYREASQSAAVVSAMSRGKVVVASSVGCIPEVIRDGVDGFLVPPEDPEALAAAIIRALRSPQRSAIGEGAKSRIVSDFSWDDNARRTIAVYQGLLRSARETAPIPAR